MTKLLKYFKNKIFWVLLIILLLISQAALDLTLPDYTSKIINVGIQQNGISSSAIEAISSSTLEDLTLFFDANDFDVFNKSYKLITSSDTKYLDKYPLLETENLYILDTTNKEEVEKMFTKVFTLSYMVDLSNSMDLSMYQIPEGMTLMDVLKNSDGNIKSQIISMLNEKAQEMPDSITNSASIQKIKQEYEKIGIDLGKMQTNYVIVAGLKMIIIALLIMAISIAIIFFGSRLASSIAKTLRLEVFKKITYFSKNEMKKFGTASLITRTTNDIQQIQQVIVLLLRVVFYAPIIAIGGILKTTTSDTSMLWIIIVAVITLFIIIGILFVTVMPKFKIFQNLLDKLNLVSRETLSGIQVIRAFSNEEYEKKRFDDANKNLTKVDLFVNRTMSLMMPLMTLLMNVVCVAIIYFGAKGIDLGTIQVGDMLAYIQYAMQIIASFLMISLISIILPRASVSAKRVNEILETNTSVKSGNKKINPDNIKSQVEFKNVSFVYPDANEKVLKNISFTANEGETIAFIGSTGSGKSTLINLIPRFYDVTSGSILIDGIDIKTMKLKDLRKLIGYVPQKGILFKGTIKDNIKYSNKNITDDQVNKALEIAQAKTFVDEKEEKLLYPISQGGTNVSGGQRQRLSIARAIAPNPKIYIFDDSFSALDFKTDAALRKSLKKVTKKSTVFIVAQRISTILHADKIIVLDEGEIKGIGKHEELIKTCPVYKEIALSQLSKEEINNA